jgi:hypothetical protein
MPDSEQGQTLPLTLYTTCPKCQQIQATAGIARDEYPDIVCEGCGHEYNRRDDPSEHFLGPIMGGPDLPLR